ncbi:MAG TPA: DUF1801 domain-containing protein [Mucilaginibacter sp.]|jgi:uncharacterized protein YdhG (YjbR/CyaY superfamily)|nr:DUF1801 domain-containing protein [Mucilaginibacter sp.]
METAIKFKTVEEYFSAFPASTQRILEEVRKTVKRAAPEAKEVISYNMPAFKLNGVLVYYAAHNEHIGFYPTASPIVAFKENLSAYKFSKGAIQFPIDKPMPVDLITRMVQFRVREDMEKAGRKRAK